MKITKEQLDKARAKIQDDDQVEFIGYELYNKFFLHSFHIGVDTLIPTTRFEKKLEGELPKYLIINHKFYDVVLANRLWFICKHDFSTYLYIFDNKFIAELNIYIVSDKVYECSCLYVYADSADDLKELIEELKQVDMKESPSRKMLYFYVTHASGGFKIKDFKIESNFNVDFKENFNDDLPVDEFDSFINKPSCGLSLLHGIPGTGKTTYIKNLIYEYGDKKNFYILDSSLLGHITEASFLSFLMEKANSVFILEDCEKLLLDRTSTNNQWIGTLLNLTDGMLGESLKIKFICTFNCDLASIDKALLRPGRLDILYEFKPLERTKSIALCDKLCKTYKNNMTLAEIYKSKSSESKLDKETKRIGF